MLGLLERLSHDPEAGVRIVVLEHRLRIDPGNRSRLLQGALQDPDPGVRAVAFQALNEWPEVLMEDLLAGLAAAGSESVVQVGLFGVRALVMRARNEPLERGAIVAVLEELSRDRDFLIRREAVAGLKALGRPVPAVGPVFARRTAEHYLLVLEQTKHRRTVAVETRHGTLRLELSCPEAPLTCWSFLHLASQGFYDGLVFFRVVPDAMIQAGDPRGDGWGGPGYTLRDEINRLRFDRGVVGMANAGSDTAGSQFFITLAPQPHLDGSFTALGRVVAGEELLDQIVQGDRIRRIVEVR
jgi:cyclophilin family peptidyl-prolyl cis-trans isomerase